MKDKDKTQQQLIKELTQLRQRIAALEKSEREHEKVEAALLAERDNSRQYLDIAEVMLVVLDKKGTITLLNRKGSHILGYKKGELIGKNWFTICLPSHLRNKVRGVFKKLMAGEKKQSEFFENLILTKSGTERTIAWHNTVLKDAQGTIIGTLSSGEDITERKRVEDTLRETSLFLRSILDSSSAISIVFTDLEQNILFWNKGAENIFGYKAKEVVNRRTVDIVYPDEEDTKQTVEEIRSFILNKKRGLRREIKEVTKAGRILWINLTSTPRLDEHGNVIGILGIGEDVTEHKQAEKALRESEEKYRNLAERANDGICIGQDGVIRYANARLAQMGGYSVEELIGAPVFDFFMPDDLPEVRDRYQRRMAGEDIPTIYETALKHKDGHWFAVEINAGIVNYQRKPADLVIIRDITERKQAEEALRASEEQFRQFFENEPEYCYMISPEGVIVNVNNAALDALGYTKEELVGKPLQTIYAPKSLPKMEQLYEKWKKTGQLKDEEMVIITKKRERRTVLLSAGVIKNSDGKILHSISVQKDITERKNIEDALRESEERFRKVVETMEVGLGAINKNGVLTYVNEYLARMLGYSIDEMIGRPTLDFYYDEESRKVQEEIFKKRRTGMRDPTSYEVTWRRKEGQKVYSILSPTPLFDADGHYTGSFAIHTDITERRRMEETLRESEEKYRELINGMNDTAWVIDFDGNFIDVNDAAVEVLGYSREELLAMGPHNIDSSLAAENITGLIKGMRTDKLQVFETTHTTKTGKAIPVEIKSTLVTYQGKQAILSIARDITERKQAEEALRESENRFRTLFEGIPDSVLVHDDKGKILHINEIGAERLEWSAKDLVGRNLRAIVTPENAASIADHVRETHKVGWCRFETTYVSRSGWKIMVEVTERPIKFGTVKAILSVAHDITERKRAEEALLESAQKYHLITNTAMDGFAEIDRNGRFLDVNEESCRMSGYSRDEHLRMSITDLEAEETSDKTTRHIKNIIETGSDRFESRLRRKDGRIIDIEASSTYFPYTDHLLIFHRDITDRKHAEQELHNSYQQMQEMLVTTVNALASTVEMKDQYTAGHQPRVTQLACAIAEEMGLPKEQIEGIRMASLIHDIGKIMVPAEILNKPGPLTEIQYEMVKMHPRAAFDILKGIKFRWPVAEIVLQHQELMDGSGYPQGLSGEEILLEARILAVANVVEAMVSHRPYRAAYEIEEALAKISKNKGTLYDPVVVDTCRKLFAEKQFTFDEAS